MVFYYQPIMNYLFELGNNAALSQAELEAVLGGSFPSKKHGAYLVAKLNASEDPTLLMHKLGGTKKIAVAVAEATDPVAAAVAYLAARVGKIQFSFTGPSAKKNGIAIKKALKAMRKSVRYVEANNTATILHNNLIEKGTDLTVLDNNLYVTKAIQPIEAFTDRDRNRPKVDSRSGMLPPKLARIMVNLAGVEKNAVILDPFCGSGTVLTEAADLGYTHLHGADISDRAVMDTKENLDWMQERLGQLLDVTVVHCDALQLETRFTPESIDAIVSEPYMGKPLHGNEGRDTLQRQITDMYPLLSGVMHQFGKLLKPGGVAVFIVPQFLYKKEWLTFDLAQAMREANLTVEPLTSTKPTILYHRENQHVGRMIYKLRKS